MSLDYSIGDIKGWKELCFRQTSKGPRMNPVTHILIWTTMTVDLGKIEGKNVDEWMFRLHFMRQFKTFSDADCFVPDPEGGEEPVPHYLTREDVEAHAGLRTNVISRTRREFLSRWRTWQLDNALRAAGLPAVARRRRR